MKYLRYIGIGIISMLVSQKINIGFVRSNHFDLITVNAVFIGFLFTSLSILLGFLNEEIVRLFEESGSLKTVYRSIELGILNGLFSITTSFANLLVFERYITSSYAINALYGLEIMFIMMTIVHLFKTLYNLKLIIDSIKIDRYKKSKEQDIDIEIQKLMDKKI